MVIGFIGSGKIGGTLAKLAVDAGHSVVLSNSRGPQTLTELVARLGPDARAATPAEAAEAGDIVVVTIPFGRYREVPAEPLKGKTVIDTNNYYFERDGRFPEIDSDETSDSEVLAAHLPEARVVKAFNSIAHVHLAEQGLPAGAENRRALPIAGDDAEAKRQVAELIDSFGFDVVDAGPLAEGRRFQRDKPAYGPRLTVAELRDALARG
ncbi:MULTISPECIES: NADPH-dependent F420 reductase [Microbispora]|uniref:NADPH-dependent F420 reductase n=3 Tax=Microbispora TaxID=2005 RepID=A0ABY3LRX7_9ACTN|nr:MULTISPECIES: NADPH-dependent F420 reductase [Microbispora]RGA06265.1 NADP oxidoreductase [Microbispora triticiradicis]TLP54599.1 NADP oxidoreductase [Microbispora fusca]TYB51566.1 NADPH-dependent F420 reductase [Microbispora tritici]GLW20808.1 NADP oxidoreductase [Microbispora amethystogenes]